MNIASMMMWAGGLIFALGAGLRLTGWGASESAKASEKGETAHKTDAVDKLVDLAHKVVEKDIETKYANESRKNTSATTADGANNLFHSFEEIQNKLDEVLKRTEKIKHTDADTAKSINIANGYKFEKYIVDKFNVKGFLLKGWEGDKFMKGMYAETTREPDLKLVLRAEEKEWPFAVECKWRSRFSQNDTLRFAKDAQQIKRYQDYQKSTGHKTFIVLGVGEPASNPKSVFIIPVEHLRMEELKELTEPTLTKKQLLPYYCSGKGKFHYDHKQEMLTILP